MTGPLIALLSAIFFALHATVVRRAVLLVSDASTGMLISVPVAVPVLFLFLAFTGQLQGLVGLPWQSYAWLSTAGIFYFVVGRTLIYECTQLVGANITSILVRFNVLVSVVVGVTVLHEPLSWRMATGVLLILVGITMTGLSPRMFRDPNGRLTKIPAKAFILGSGCGVAIGIAPIFVKLGLNDTISPIAAVFISYLAATPIVSLALLKRKKRTSIARIPIKAAGLFAIAGFLSLGANLARFGALSLAPASVVAPLVWTFPVFLLIFSFLFNRQLEILNRAVIIGTLTVVIGSILLI
ncbi:MAG: DMT family transporter [Deltaproteobacteria bacterium]|nr:DMT family transporter [Deltaproteobacteria bacterium]